MKYYLIFALYQKDEGELWTAFHLIMHSFMPDMKWLNDYCEMKTFSKFIGITGITELSKSDYDTLIANES